MTMLKPQEGAIPLPQPSVLSEPYWDGCRRGELLFMRCNVCLGATAAPALICSHCTSERIQWEKSSGFGTIYSWTTVWRPQTPEFTVPYVAVIAMMNEGWPLLSNLVDCDHDIVTIDMRVRARFHQVPRSSIVLPYLAPA
jgi:uncharacterized OB-fold protein